MFITIQDTSGRPIPSCDVRLSIIGVLNPDGSDQTDDKRTDLAGNVAWTWLSCTHHPNPKGYRLAVNTANKLPQFKSAVLMVRDLEEAPITITLDSSGGGNGGGGGNAGEVGRVRVDDLVFRRENGSIFQWRGFSDFRLFERFVRGEDIGLLLSERIGFGANVLRVFGMYHAGVGGGIGVFHPQDVPDYVEKLGAFADLLSGRGLRFEFTMFADAQSVMPNQAEQIAHADRVGRLLAGKPNAFIETCNEPFKNGVDVERVIPPSGAPRATGRYDLAVGQHTMFRLEYVTLHTERKAEWPRTARALDEIREGFSWPPGQGAFAGTHCPVVGDEPTGFAEVADGDRRSDNPDDAAYYAATAALMGAGATFHSDDGIQSRPLGPVQKRCAEAWFDALKWVPVEAQLAPYCRGDASGPCNWIGESFVQHDDAIELRSFGKRVGNKGYIVQIRTKRQHATACGGSQIVAEPRRGFVEVKR